MKLMIRNTSRDRTTEALRKSRPGDVQASPVIAKVRLPPGGSLTVSPKTLSQEDVTSIVTLMGCGCLAVFKSASHGPLVRLSPEDVQDFCAVTPPPAPVIEAPELPPVTEPVPEPVPVEEPVEEPPAATEPPPEVPDEGEPEEPPFLKDELLALKNSELRDILADKGFDKTSGMNKAALVDAILDLQGA